MTVLDFAAPVTLREPPGNISTALGDEFCEFAETCGIFLDPWQKWLVRMATSQLPSGLWAAFENAVITPRQNGKNYYLRVLQLGYLFLMDDDLLVHSAHQWDTVNVHRKWFMDLLESHDEFGALLKPVDRRTGRSKSFVNINGDEQVVLTTGQSIVFKTRSGGKGRGFTGDKVFFDEAQKLGAGSMGDTVPVLSTRGGAQVHYTGSAPDETSAVLHAVIQRGKSDNTEDRLFVAEWGNNPDALDLDPETPEFMEAIRNANPAVIAGRITDAYVRQEIFTFSGTPDLVEEHRRERLGVRTPPASAKNNHPVDPVTWKAIGWEPATVKDRPPEITEAYRIALDVSPDHQWATFGVAGRCKDRRVQIEIADRRHGTGHVVARAVQFAHDHEGFELIIDQTGPAASFITKLEAAGVTVQPVTAADHAKATGMFLDEANAGTLRHLNDPFLTAEVNGAVLQMSSDASRWGRRASKVPIPSLVACTLALGQVPVVSDSTPEPFVIYA